MKKAKIGFRVDAGNIIGAGHLMEVLAIFNNLSSKLAIDPVMITSANDFAVDKMIGSGINRENIRQIAKNIISEDLSEEQDIQETQEILKNNQCDRLVVNLPNRSKRYYEKLQGKVKDLVIILDNDASQEINASLVVNFSIAQDLAFYERLADKDRYLIGPSYMPLNENILKRLRKKAIGEVKSVFVNQGGSDPYGFTKVIISAMERVGGHCMVDVLAGGLLGRKVLQELKNAIKLSDHHEYILHENLLQEKVFSLMESTDIAVSAAGNTLYELAYFGVPTIMIAPRKEFLGITRSFANAGNIDLGLKDDIKEEDLTGMIGGVINDQPLRKKTSENLQKLVDGKGTERISRNICRILEK